MRGRGLTSEGPVVGGAECLQGLRRCEVLGYDKVISNRHLRCAALSLAAPGRGSHARRPAAQARTRSSTSSWRATWRSASTCASAATSGRSWAAAAAASSASPSPSRRPPARASCRSRRVWEDGLRLVQLLCLIRPRRCLLKVPTHDGAALLMTRLLVSCRVLQHVRAARPAAVTAFPLHARCMQAWLGSVVRLCRSQVGQLASGGETCHLQQLSAWRHGAVRRTAPAR